MPALVAVIKLRGNAIRIVVYVRKFVATADQSRLLCPAKRGGGQRQRGGGGESGIVGVGRRIFCRQ